MKLGSTLFLKLALFIIGVPVLTLGIFGLTWLPHNPVKPEYTNIVYPILIIFYVSVIPFFIALYQAFHLLSFIDKNNAFSAMSVKALKNIKYCAITFCGLYVIGLPFFYIIAELDDAPGVVIIGMIPVFASMVIAVFAAVLQRLLEEAIEIKSENDLTV